MALVYFAIGFYCKVYINQWFNAKERKYDVTAVALIVLLICFSITNYCGEERIYYFDMKPLYYKELILAIVIPCAFGIVLGRLIFWLEKIKLLRWLQNGLSYLGQMTIPIMFMHVPLNTWHKNLGYGRFMYVLIGIGVPIVFTLVFRRFQLMQKMFGLPVIKRVK